MNDYILIQALSATENHRLRAGDTIHMATALSIAATADESQVVMVSADTELLLASKSAGIGALDPQTDDALSSLHQIRD